MTADLASATIGGTQYRNYRTVGPYLLASLVGVAGATKTPLSATASARSVCFATSNRER